MRTGVWLFLAAAVSAILTASCGSIVRSKPEGGPPPDQTKMDGLTYWLPKGGIVIEGTWDKDKADWKFTVTPHIEADTSQRWRLTRKVNYLFEDTVTLEVDAKTGLLKTVSGTSTNKTVDIIAEGLAVAAKVMTFGAAGPLGTRQLSRAPTPTPTPCGEEIPPVHFTGSFRYMIDHLPKDETQDTCQDLLLSSPPTSNSTIPATPTPTPTPTPTATPVTYKIVIHREDRTDPPQKPVKTCNLSDGIVVRAPAPYRVIMTGPHNMTDNARAEQLVFLPDAQHNYCLSLDRSPFVTNQTQITLIDGVVQNRTETRPSIILGIVGIPKKILDALVPLPH